MKQDLTEKQQRLLTFLERQIANKGSVPSLRETAACFGVSHASVVQILKALEKKGYIKRSGHYSREIHILNKLGQSSGLQRFREIPIIGKIAAGLPLYAQQEWAGTLVVDGSLYRGPNLFALRVRGDSMTGAGILSEDLVVCEPRQYASNGEIVVALVSGEEATVKRFFLHSDRVELRPENSGYDSIYLGFSDVLIQGKVIGVQRGSF